MPSGIRDALTATEREHLRAEMNWVIPADSSPGAGTDAGIERLLELIDALDDAVKGAYLVNLGSLTESGLADPSNAFAAMFIDHVRDVYYAYPETGSWADIGFVVTER